VFQPPVGWRVKIGNWNGVFVFRQNGSCSWSESGGPEHTGSWKITGGEVQWTYSDDAEGWERIFHARLPLKIRVSGEATIHGVDHGYYEMSKQRRAHRKRLTRLPCAAAVRRGRRERGRVEIWIVFLVPL
jgi:hypothetical protein